MVLCCIIDKQFRLWIVDKEHSQQKINEKRIMLSSESFKNIRTLKFYGWDSYFKNEIIRLRDKQTQAKHELKSYHLTLSFIWTFLPNLMSALSFSIFIAFGNTLDLSQALEMLILFDMLRDDFNAVMNLQQEIADVRIGMFRVQSYLDQQEADIEKIVNKVEEDSDFAVKIKNKDFTWGL